MLVDSHCHLYYIEHKSIEKALDDARACGVDTFLCIGASQGLSSIEQTLALADQYQDVYATVGVHPHNAGKQLSVDALRQFVNHPKVVAIGETGLDYNRDWGAPQEAQVSYFEQTIDLAIECQKPLIIHCRDAKEDVLNILQEKNAAQVGGVVHCYSEDISFAKSLIEINFIVSFTGVVTFKKAHVLRETLREIPLDKMMLETDCPYMAPEPFRGKPSEPKHVLQIAEKIAEVKGVSLEEVAKVTTATFNKIFLN